MKWDGHAIQSYKAQQLDIVVRSCLHFMSLDIFYQCLVVCADNQDALLQKMLFLPVAASSFPKPGGPQQNP